MDSANQSLDDLREIRNLMERSTRFLSLSGLSGVSAGLIAILGASIAFFVLDYDQRYFEPESYFSQESIHHSRFIPALITDGSLVLISSLLASFFFTYRRAKKKKLPLWDNTSRRMLLALSIPLIAGGILCIVLIFHHLFYLVAPVTLIFYGLALVSAGNFTLQELKYLGISELILGIIALLFAGFGLIFWAAGFGLLHVVYGFRMYLKYER